MFQKYPAYHMKANVFSPLFLVENREIKGQFLSPEVGANATLVFLFRVNTFPAALYGAAASRIL